MIDPGKKVTLLLLFGGLAFFGISTVTQADHLLSTGRFPVE